MDYRTANPASPYVPPAPEKAQIEIDLANRALGVGTHVTRCPSCGECAWLVASGFFREPECYRGATKLDFKCSLGHEWSWVRPSDDGVASDFYRPLTQPDARENKPTEADLCATESMVGHGQPGAFYPFGYVELHLICARCHGSEITSYLAKLVSRTVYDMPRLYCSPCNMELVVLNRKDCGNRP